MIDSADEEFGDDFRSDEEFGYDITSGLADLRDEHDPRRIMWELDLIDERNRFRQEGD